MVAFKFAARLLICFQLNLGLLKGLVGAGLINWLLRSSGLGYLRGRPLGLGGGTLGSTTSNL